MVTLLVSGIGWFAVRLFRLPLAGEADINKLTVLGLHAGEGAMPLKREALGFALAPLPVVAPFTLLFGVILLDRTSDSGSVVEAWLQLVLASYGVALLIGLPVHFALKRIGRRSLRAYLVATTLGVASIVGGTGLLQLLLPPSAEQNPFGLSVVSRTGTVAMLGFEGLALAGAWIFWRVSIRQRGHETTASNVAAGA